MLINIIYKNILYLNIKDQFKTINLFKNIVKQMRFQMHLNLYLLNKLEYKNYKEHYIIFLKLKNNIKQRIFYGILKKIN